MPLPTSGAAARRRRRWARRRRFVLGGQFDSPRSRLGQCTLFVATTIVVRLALQAGPDGADRPLPTRSWTWSAGPITGCATCAQPRRRQALLAVGSASNIGERGMQAEEGRALIWEYDFATRARRMFGTGLRNPNGMAWSPWSGELWTVVNERDMLGSDLVPDYLTNVPVGANYGWPWVYWKNNIDQRVKSGMPQFMTEYTRQPEYSLGPHVAPLGLVFSQGGNRLGTRFQQGAFIANHGSWNRSPPSGYNVVYVAFDARGNPQGAPIPVLSGFLTGKGTTQGRPTWLAWARTARCCSAMTRRHHLERDRPAQPRRPCDRTPPGRRCAAEGAARHAGSSARTTTRASSAQPASSSRRARRGHGPRPGGLPQAARFGNDMLQEEADGRRFGLGGRTIEDRVGAQLPARDPPAIMVQKGTRFPRGDRPGRVAAHQSRPAAVLRSARDSAPRRSRARARRSSEQRLAAVRPSLR